MRRVVVDMQNALFADATAQALRSFDPDFDVVLSENPGKTLEMCDYSGADTLIMEVTAYSPWRLEERMKLRDALGQSRPQCRIVLLVDENTEKELAGRVRLAKKNGLIDGFLYGSVSAAYLSAVIDTL